MRGRKVGDHATAARQAPRRLTQAGQVGSGGDRSDGGRKSGRGRSAVRGAAAGVWDGQDEGGTAPGGGVACGASVQSSDGSRSQAALLRRWRQRGHFIAGRSSGQSNTRWPRSARGSPSHERLAYLHTPGGCVFCAPLRDCSSGSVTGVETGDSGESPAHGPVEAPRASGQNISLGRGILERVESHTPGALSSKMSKKEPSAREAPPMRGGGRTAIRPAGCSPAPVSKLGPVQAPVAVMGGSCVPGPPVPLDRWHAPCFFAVSRASRWG